MRGPRRPAVLVVAVLLLLTLAGARLVQAGVDAQEERLLEKRANEVNLVLGNSVTSLSQGLDGLAAVLRATDSARLPFERTARTVVGDDPNVGVAVVRRQDGAWVVALAEGTGLRPGQVLSGPRAAALDAASSTDDVVPTGVIGDGDDRAIGFALGPPATPTGEVLYRESALGPLSAPAATSSAPFSDLAVALFASPQPDESTAIVATAASDELPLSGGVETLPFLVGETPWSLQVAATRPLVGELTSNAAWFALGIGVVVSVLVGAVVEATTRRRDSALALYRSEHRIAENLQRGFLPTLPDVDGLEIAARYLAGSTEQEVGGDWYDVFALSSGEVGVVIGDVLGHDVGAAIVMSRVQTALRAFASRGGEPGDVLDDLDEHLDLVQADRLTTLFYGILGAPRADGGRSLRFANAGHLCPVVRHPDNTVEELTSERSVLVGVPGGHGLGRAQRSIDLEPGSTVLLFTDGLVEVPGRSLTDALREVAETVRSSPLDAGPELLCSRLVSHMHPGPLRDDVAVLAVRVCGLGGVPRSDAG